MNCYIKTFFIHTQKNYDLGQQLAEAFIIDSSLISEIKMENINLIMSIVQQWIYLHYKGGIAATPTLKSIIADNLKLSLPFIDATKYLLILDKFLGPSPNLSPALASLKDGGNILKEILKAILSHPITLDELTQKSLINNVPRYVVTALNLVTIDCRTFKTFELEMLKELQKKVTKSPIINFSLAFCKWNDQPSLKDLTAVANVLSGILSESKTVVTSPAMIESCLNVAKCLRPIVDTLNPVFDCDSLLLFFKFVKNLIKVLMHCDSETDRGYCSECKNTKRHVTDVLINIVVSTFDAFGKRKEVSVDLVADITDLFTYKLLTADGLKCSNKDRMIENSLLKIYGVLAHETMLGEFHFLSLW